MPNQCRGATDDPIGRSAATSACVPSPNPSNVTLEELKAVHCAKRHAMTAHRREERQKSITPKNPDD